MRHQEVRLREQHADGAGDRRILERGAELSAVAEKVVVLPAQLRAVMLVGGVARADADLPRRLLLDLQQHRHLPRLVLGLPADLDRTEQIELQQVLAGLADAVDRERVSFVPLALAQHHVGFGVLRALDLAAVEHAFGSGIDDVRDVGEMLLDVDLRGAGDVDVCVAALQEELLEGLVARLVLLLGELLLPADRQLLGQRKRFRAFDSGFHGPHPYELVFLDPDAHGDEIALAEGLRLQLVDDASLEIAPRLVVSAQPLEVGLKRRRIEDRAGFPGHVPGSRLGQDLGL